MSFRHVYLRGDGSSYVNCVYRNHPGDDGCHDEGEDSHVSNIHDQLLLYIALTSRITPALRPLRTWKTLAGRAGIRKDMRDRLQNHIRASDVSARHYDRYDYLAERLAAVEQWDAFLVRILAGEFENHDVRQSAKVAA